MKVTHIALADGLVFSGHGLIERDDIVTGELVFSTSMCGYTELLTDPSYYGQIVVMANPEIGNYGVNFDDFQSDGIKIKALVVRQLSACASSHRADLTLRDWLIREHIPVIFGVDTRALIAHIREKGAMMAAVASNRALAIGQLVDKAKMAEPMSGTRLSKFVSVKKPERVDDNSACVSPLFHVVVMDFGVKRSIVRYLSQEGARVTLMPGNSSPEEIWAQGPDGLFLSNGPGDPETEQDAVATVRSLLGKLPIFGVCLGHQILAQALGHATYKLKFGHRGSNQAVKCGDGRLITTAQNHGFAVFLGAEDRLSNACNISDGTNEGIAAQDLWAFSVQFHPEGAPGPLDATFYFKNFFAMMALWKNRLQGGDVSATAS
jgi:carbamoyl-phosphate synthase small subunit